jgi:RHS repeat-associated protein
MHFTGKMRDAESNLDDFDARYYSSQWGRFMSPHWGDERGAVPYAKLDEPQNLDLCGYVLNNLVRKLSVKLNRDSWRPGVSFSR